MKRLPFKMFHHLLFAAMVALLPTTALAGGAVEAWMQRYNGPGNSDDRATAVAADDSGNVYVTGYSSGSGTGNDYTTIKYSSEGVPLWTNRYNGPGNGRDRATAVAVDTNANVFVTGRSIIREGDYDYVTIKYSSAGGWRCGPTVTAGR